MDVRVFSREGEFGGWPANNGIWLWGNEILVGFIHAIHAEKSSHTYDEATALRKFGRSLDGGNTWAVEDACTMGLAGKSFNHNVQDMNRKYPVDCPGNIPFSKPGFALTFGRMNNGSGPSHFYLTANRGRKWHGPFIFPDIEGRGIAARTDYIIEGESTMKVFLTASKANRREGRILCAQTEDGGRSWHKVSWIGTEPDGESDYTIMPASARISKSAILVIARTKKGTTFGLNTYISRDDGLSWQDITSPQLGNLPGQVGSPVRNPPALIKLRDGRLFVSYGIRTEPARICGRFSSDNGLTWGDEIIIRGGDGASWDMGYPRMVQRPDGRIVVVYYYNNALLGVCPFRYIAATIIDPVSISGTAQK